MRNNWIIQLQGTLMNLQRVYTGVITDKWMKWVAVSWVGRMFLIL